MRITIAKVPPKKYALQPEEMASQNLALSCAKTLAADDESLDSDVPFNNTEADLCSMQKDFYFVDRPSHDFFCPVSLELLLEPKLTSCCGHHLSEEVATRLQREEKPCPMCNAEEWSAVLDKYHRRKVHEVRVLCWQKENGCKWVGEVNGLKQHADSCEKRPWECEYCELKCTYVEGGGKHFSVCPNFPEPCPNGCEVGKVERCNMKQHRSTCSFEPVACKMEEFGCSVVVPRKELAKHMKDSELQHLTAMTMLNLRLTRQLQQRAAERDSKIAQMQLEMTKIQLEMTKMQTEMKDEVKTMMNKTIKEQKQMQVEQRMKLAELHMKSDVHKQMQSDMQTEIKLKFNDQKVLLSRLEQVLASDHRVSKLQVELNEKIAHLEREMVAKLELQRKTIETVRLSINGVGANVNTQISKLNQLVSAIPQGSHALEPAANVPAALGDCASSCSGTELLIFTQYSRDKGTGVCRSSDPFYSHDQGYKLKLNITFYSTDSEANDIGADLYLMKGEYDRQLDWPVEINVRLEVVNQAGRFRTGAKSATCNWKKTEKEQARTIDSCLMKYSTLERGARSVQYMKNDCLKFKITVTI